MWVALLIQLRLAAQHSTAVTLLFAPSGEAATAGGLRNWPFRHDRGCRHSSAEILPILAGRSFSLLSQDSLSMAKHATLPTAECR